MSSVTEKLPREEGLPSADVVRLAAEVTGGPRIWFSWQPGSGQTSLRVPPGFVFGLDPISVSLPGRSIESGAKWFEEASERWREVPRPAPPKPQRRTRLAHRMDEIRERIKASGQPLLSWEEIERELARRRGEEA